MKLTLYMFKPHVTKFSQCLKPKSESRKYKNITSQSRRNSDPDLMIYSLEKEAKVPSWVNFVAGFSDPKELESMKIQSASALILVRIHTNVGPRIFAATYGSAFSLVDTSLIESDFGLKTTINTISPSKIKNINYKNLSSRAFGRSENVKRASSIAKFAFEHESEVLKSISGTSLDHDLGFSISGSSSLKISVKDLQPEQLPLIVSKAYEKYVLQTYKEHFDFIDHFEEEKDVAVIADLDNQLLTALSHARPGEKLYLAYPDQIPAEQCSYFKLTVNNTSENFDEIELGSLHKFIQGNATILDIETLKSDSYIIGLDDNEEASTARKSIYSMLGFETKLNDNLYVLSDSKWYKIGNEFLNTLNIWAGKNTKLSDLKVKTWFATQSEWDYCQQHQEQKDYLVLSRKSYHPKRHGELFMADLYHKSSGSLIFVKKLSTGTSFSHLLDQAVATADLLREDDPHAWKFLSSQINEKWPEISKEVISKNLKIIILANTDKNLPLDLPVFTKVALKKSLKTINKLQIETSLLPVSIGISA